MLPPEAHWAILVIVIGNAALVDAGTPSPFYPAVPLPSYKESSIKLPPPLGPEKPIVIPLRAVAPPYSSSEPSVATEKARRTRASKKEESPERR